MPILCINWLYIYFKNNLLFQDSQHILGSEEYGKTRSQTRKFSESEDNKKPAVKRTSTMAQTAKVRGREREGGREGGKEWLAGYCKINNKDDKIHVKNNLP